MCNVKMAQNGIMSLEIMRLHLRIFMGTLRRMIYITDNIGIERLNLKGKTNIIAHRAGPDFLSKVQEHKVT